MRKNKIDIGIKQIVLYIGTFICCLNCGCEPQWRITHWEREIELTKISERAKVKGVSIELVDSDVEKKTASIRISSCPDVLTTREGNLFEKDNEALELASVSRDGVIVIARGCDAD